MSNESDAAIAIVKKAAYEFVLKKVISKAITKLPFLAFPVINPIFIFIVEKIIMLAYDEMELMAQLAYIDIKTYQQKKKYEEATEVLKTAIQGEKSEEEKRKAFEEYKKRLRDLVNMSPK